MLRRLAVCAIVAGLLLIQRNAIAPAAMSTTTLFVGHARIDVITSQGADQASPDEVLVWVKAAAESVSAYFGRFPVPRLAIEITSFSGSGIRHGMAFPAEQGGRITIRVGSNTSAADFASDWTLTHEMVHLGFPSVDEKHHWIEEGLATYVEPIARIHAGHLTAEEMWSDLIVHMPYGLPESDDRGLDGTRAWGRTYWGGAIFCLLAAVEIRRETKNSKGLEDALRAILAAGGDIRHDWNLIEALRVGDQATGTHVLEKEYEKMKDKPTPVDLDALWKDLGVRRDGKRVKYDDGAPLAAIRRAITSFPTSAGASLHSAVPPVILVGRPVGARKRPS